eukprot:688341-Rhodomonas_salina.3
MASILILTHSMLDQILYQPHCHATYKGPDSSSRSRVSSASSRGSRSGSRHGQAARHMSPELLSSQTSFGTLPPLIDVHPRHHHHHGPGASAGSHGSSRRNR